MTAQVIDGKAYAAKLRGLIAEGVEAFKAETGIVPGLAVVLVGEDPASRVYVANKAKQTVEVGMASFEYKLPADVSQDALVALVDELNARDDVDGILVQLANLHIIWSNRPNQKSA